MTRRIFGMLAAGAGAGAALEALRASSIGKAGGDVLTTVTDVSAAEMLNLVAAPKVLVPSPGAHRVLVPIGLGLETTIPTAGYVNPGGQLVVGFSASEPVTADFSADAAFIFDSFFSLQVAFNAGTVIQNSANHPLVLAKAGSNFTTGDGILRLTVAYHISPSFF